MRSVIRDLPGSKIREVANAGMGCQDVLAFWFGESDRPRERGVHQVVGQVHERLASGDEGRSDRGDVVGCQRVDARNAGLDR